MSKASEIVFWATLGYKILQGLKQRKAEKDANKIGRIENLLPSMKTVALSIKDALPMLVQSEVDVDVNNGEIVGSGDFYTLSAGLQTKTGLPRIITTQTQLRRALSASKRDDGTILLLKTENAPNRKQTRRQTMERAYNMLSSGDMRDLHTEHDGYVAALIYICEGGKFRWEGDHGLKEELFGNDKKGLDKRVKRSAGERRAYAQIIDNNNGITPERLAEQLAQYGQDDYFLKNGILDALRENNSPAVAFSTLQNMDAQFLFNQTAVPF